MQMVYSLFATLNKSLRTSLETEFQLISTILDKTKRTFSPYCALSNAAKPFPKQHTCPKQRLSRKKFSSPNHCCFLQTPKDQTFFWRRNSIASRGTGRGKNRYSYGVQRNALQVCNFLKNFVQDCSVYWKFISVPRARPGVSLSWFSQ